MCFGNLCRENSNLSAIFMLQKMVKRMLKDDFLFFERTASSVRFFCIIIAVSLHIHHAALQGHLTQLLNQGQGRASPC